MRGATAEQQLDAWLAELDCFNDIPFMEDGRQQPPMPEDEDLFE